MAHKILKIHPDDNVFVALTDLAKNEPLEYNGTSIPVAETIRAKHKFTEAEMKKGDPVIMYGTLVGIASEAIEKGSALTTHNVSHKAQSFSEKTATASWEALQVPQWASKTFLGYHRADGQVGTANYWLVIPLVFCENRNVEVMKEAFLEELGFLRPNRYKKYVQQMAQLYREGRSIDIETITPEDDTAFSERLFPNVDGIKFLTHQGGCGGTREDAEMLCSLIAGYLHNPNVAGATVLSLGCQNAQIHILQEKLQEKNPDFQKPLFILEQQQEGTEAQLLSKAIKQTFTGLMEANKLQRSPAPLSKLTIGLECGGSDGFSGISANPAVGHVSDIIASLGGTTLLAEFPELCGVEQELINRCTHKAISQKFIQLMRTYARSAEAAGSGFDMNPSPGNIKDGLITDAMKSAGAAKKGGTSPVTDVLDYAETATKPGLNLLCTPGNDVESTTALAGSGATIILFTTGLGTPTGNPIAPVIKIASNSELAKRMPDIIDVDTGAIITGGENIAQSGEKLLDFIVKVASGELRTKAQELHQDDFIPWKRGISL